ncbi:nitrogenase-associated protein [Roseiarcus fermentans]|uniref:Nitrogenase-associated protein n=1 Tax=Roseiarcus fermentans TaxID=1473586 RepID=A0A366ENH7_9HYPH|nr:ArsC/Spx/MgsR family protein [Roseiarcus fermentans]RBP03516.1 nitrogenase-associated protein [Roseiarcus fermentans]
MAKVVFYEKPGCGGNARQKAALSRSGHELDVRDLLSTPWTAEALRAFFGARPVAAWFNAASPRVKSGAVKPESLDADGALALMLADPLLIRRPLIEADGRREAGFDADLIDAWIGLQPAAAPVGEGCPRELSAEAAACVAPAAAGPR